MTSAFDLEEALTARLRQAANERYRLFSLDILTALLLVPEWTTTLAVRAGLARDDTVDALVEQLDAAGIVDRRPSLASDGRPEQTFWVRPAERGTLVAHLRWDGSYLRPVLSGLRDRLAGVDELRDWIFVASNATGAKVVHRVDTLAGERRFAEAAAVVSAATAIGEVLGGALADAARRAGWRLDRAYRAEQDEHHLRRYVHRAEVEDAIDDLLGDGPQWAIHLRGPGGVGKTMVIRYLTSGRYAADRGRKPFPVARADFDHLDPRFPEQRPAELLLVLANDLIGYGASRESSRRFERFGDAVRLLHEELAGTDPNPAAARQLLLAVVDQFARFVAELPAPVLLVLDTCEELAKLYTPGSAAPAIDRTFEILELVHERTPQVRVVLSGRRWLTPPSDEIQSAAGPRLERRPYVRLVPVAGYTGSEASRFLSAWPIPYPLRSAVLDRVRGPDMRFNPFELTAYAAWAEAEPDLDPMALLTAPGDPYVERRIVGRLSGAARDALPVAVAFGRFDLALVKPALDRLGLDAQAAFDALAAQEWMHTLSIDRRGRPGVVEVDDNLLPRLRATVGDAPDPARLGRDAAEVIAATDLPDIPVETIEAAVRLLPSADAAVLWRLLDRRVLEERAWGWAANVTARAGAVEALRSGPSILAAILATKASAKLHTGATHELPGIWNEVLGLAARHPDPAARRALWTRAALGLLARGVTDDELLTYDAIVDPTPDGLVAAAEGLLAAGKDFPSLFEALTQALPDLPRELHAAGAAALAGWMLRNGHGTRARNHAERAVYHAVAVEAGAPWPDWRTPRRLRDRCLLVLTLAARPPGVPTLLDMLPHVEDIDAERLASALLDAMHRHGPLSAEVVEAVFDTAGYMPGRRPDYWAHAFTRPLAVALAEALSVNHDEIRAVNVLDATIIGAQAAGDDPDTVDACCVAKLRIARRYRDASLVPELDELCASSNPAVRAEAWLVRTLTRNEPPLGPDEAGGFPAWWRCQTSTGWSLPTVPDGPDLRWLATLAEAGDVPDVDLAALGDPLAALRPDTLADLVRYFAVSGLALIWPTVDVPDFLSGRAKLEAGEVLALRFPDRGGDLLREAERELRRAGDEVGAAQAAVLAELANRRAGRPAEALAASTVDSLRELPGWAPYTEAVAGTDPHAGPDLPEFPRPRPAPARRRWRLPVSVPSLLFSLAGIAAITVAVVAVLPVPWLGVPLGVLIGSMVDFIVRLATNWTGSIHRSSLIIIGRHDPEYRLIVSGLRKLTYGLSYFWPWSGPNFTLNVEQVDAPLLLPGLVQRERIPSIVELHCGRNTELVPWEQLIIPMATPRLRRNLLFVRRVEDRGSSRVPVRPLSHLVGTPVDMRGTVGFRLLDTGEVVYPAATPLTVLQILQAEPGDVSRPLDDEREQFIRLAESCVAGGTPAVLVIPSVGPTLAPHVERVVVRRAVARLRSPGPAALVRLQRDLKRLLAPEDPPDGESICADVLLFLRD